MRVFTAGCFVMTMMFIAVMVVSSWDLFETAPPIPFGVGLAIFFLSVCVLSLWLFNPKGSDPFGLKSDEEYLRDLREYGLLETSEFRATRAFGVEEYDEEGLSYYLELEDGRVLFLGGQYLYHFEPITDDPEVNQERRFPCTQFTILRHKSERYVIDIQCEGSVIEPELMTPPFGKRDWREGHIPQDGEIISDISYDTLKEIRSRGSSG